MTEAILKSLTGTVKNELTSKAGISENIIDEILKISGNVATREVASQVTSGGLDGVMNLFSKQTNNSSANNLQNNLINGLVSNFSSKLGLNQQQSTMAANIIVPAMISLITKENSKTPDNDPSPIQQIFKMNKNIKGATGLAGNLLGKFLKG